MSNTQQSEAIKKAVDLLSKEHGDLSNMLQEGGLLKNLMKGLLEKALSSEMDEHLGYEKHARQSDSKNARNGVSKKSIMTEQGVIDIDVPRDRSSDFEPVIIPKRSRRFEGLDDKVLSLYSKGMTVSDIKEQISELYGGANISESLISKITDEIIEEVKAWQSRPLESIYPIVYFDCLVVKVRQDKRIINKAVYVALGIDLNGHKDVLGLWMSENEGSKFWLNNFTDLKNRGLQDIFIACTDNLTGMNQAIEAIYPKTEHQLCIVHQIRNSLRYVSYKDRKALAKDLKLIYRAATEDEALSALELFEETWGKQYPHIARSWKSNWDNLVIFLQYPEIIRRVIYTTNAIESLNSQFRKAIKNKRVFPTDNSVFKILFLTIERVTKKWSMPIRDWNQAMAYFSVRFEGRLAGN